MIEVALLCLFPVAVLSAAIMDLFSMTISNKISIALIAGFAVLSVATGMDLQTIGWNLALATLVLAIGFACFYFGWVGGGDVKLAASVVLWLGFENSTAFFIYSGLFGGLLTILLLMARRFALPTSLMQVEWISRLHSKDEGVPYGIAMGPAALALYPDTRWMAYVYENAAWLV
ncbi:MAG: prepilin peptidase [Pseudomonadota bacterium]